MSTRIRFSLVLLSAMLAYGGILFSDGLTIAQTQSQLEKEVSAHPEKYLQFASDPVYQPLFASYHRELELLERYLVAEDQPAASMKLKRIPLFSDLLKSHRPEKQQQAARTLFLKFAEPTVDVTTVFTYQTGRKISKSIGLELPELKVS